MRECILFFGLPIKYMHSIKCCPGCFQRSLWRFRAKASWGPLGFGFDFKRDTFWFFVSLTSARQWLYVWRWSEQAALGWSQSRSALMKAWSRSASKAVMTLVACGNLRWTSFQSVSNTLILVPVQDLSYDAAYRIYTMINTSLSI